MEIQSVDQFEQVSRASREMMRIHVRSWISSVCMIMNVSPTALAKLAGLSPQTLSQLMSQDRATIPALGNAASDLGGFGTRIPKAISEPDGAGGSDPPAGSAR